MSTEAPIAAASRVGDVEFEFVDEVPKTQRKGGTITPRQAFPWEHALSPVRKEPGRWAKILTFGEGEKAAGSARTKAQSISSYLYKTVPHEEWKVTARERDEVWGVYVRFNGELDEAAQEARHALHRERSERIQKARANRES